MRWRTAGVPSLLGAPTVDAGRRGVQWRTESLTAWTFLAPTLLLLFLITVYPLGYAFYLSLTDTQLGAAAHFVGLRNFIRLPRTQIFSLTLGNTIWYTIVAVAALYPLLWSFGASVTDSQGRLTLDSPATNAALDYVRKLFAQMEPTVLSWDDSGNNKYMLSGRGSYTINAPSIYLKAQHDKMAFAASVMHSQPPAGVKGRFYYADIHGWGIFKFSKNVDLAKRLLRSMYTDESQKLFLTLGEGYDLPVLPHFDVNPPYASDPQLKVEVGFLRNAHLVAYPAPPDPRAEVAYQTYVIPNMFARAVQGSNKDAISFAMKALGDIGYS